MATDNAIIPANAKIHQLMSILYAYTFSHLFIAYHAKGVAISIEINTNLMKSFDNKATMLVTSAPNTLRIPISLVRSMALYVAKPNSPKQAIKIAKKEKRVNSFLNLKSARYCSLKLSFKKLYKNGLCGANSAHFCSILEIAFCISEVLTFREIYLPYCE